MKTNFPLYDTQKLNSFFKTIRNLYFSDFIFLFFLFLLGIFVGYLSSLSDPDLIPILLKELEGRLMHFDSKNLFIFAVQIFLNNSIISFLGFLFGILFGIVPIFIVFFNGFIFGVVYDYISAQKSILFFMAGFLPHGVFEITAVLFSCALGFRLGRLLLVRLIKPSRKKQIFLKSEFIFSLKLFFFIVVPLLLIAAFIESFITGSILRLF